MAAWARRSAFCRSDRQPQHRSRCLPHNRSPTDCTRCIPRSPAAGLGGGVSRVPDRPPRDGAHPRRRPAGADSWAVARHAYGSVADHHRPGGAGGAQRRPRPLRRRGGRGQHGPAADAGARGVPAGLLQSPRSGGGVRGTGGLGPRGRGDPQRPGRPAHRRPRHRRGPAPSVRPCVDDSLRAADQRPLGRPDRRAHRRRRDHLGAGASLARPPGLGQQRPRRPRVPGGSGDHRRPRLRFAVAVPAASRQGAGIRGRRRAGLPGDRRHGGDLRGSGRPGRRRRQGAGRLPGPGAAARLAAGPVGRRRDASGGLPPDGAARGMRRPRGVRGSRDLQSGGASGAQAAAERAPRGAAGMADHRSRRARDRRLAGDRDRAAVRSMARRSPASTRLRHGDGRASPPNCAPTTFTCSPARRRESWAA